VVIRSIEMILLERGLKLPKVSILVGGPDWPTSVLCGILRLDLFQVCLGTLPVVFISSPCVLAGAFMSGPSADLSEADKSLWDSIANAALSISTLGQLMSGVLAMNFVQSRLSQHIEELSRYRPEHDDVRALTIAEQELNECYSQVTSWRQMSRLRLALVGFSTAGMLLSCFIFVFFDETCFKNFGVKDRITDPEGLNCPKGDFGCALNNLVERDPFPTGWCALVLFFFACAAHTIFLKHSGRLARALLAKRKREKSKGGKPIEPEIVSMTRL